MINSCLVVIVTTKLTIILIHTTINNKNFCAGVLLPYMQASIYLVGAPWPDREINANADLKMFFFLFLPIYRRRKTKINTILLITHPF